MNAPLPSTASLLPGPEPVRLVSGYYQLIEGQDGAFMFNLRAGNHETVLTSRLFWSRLAALDAVEMLRQVSQQPAQFVRLNRADGREFFEVLGPDGQALARSELYASRSGVLSGMASVRRNGPAQRFRGLVRRARLTAEGVGIGQAAWPAQSGHNHPSSS